MNTNQVVFDYTLPIFCDPIQHNRDVSPESYRVGTAHSMHGIDDVCIKYSG